MIHRAPMLAHTLATRAGLRPPPTPPRLTDRQEGVLAAIETYQAKHGVSPTLRELASLTGQSTSTTRDHVRALYRKGVLVPRRTGDGRAIARTWVIARPAP